jgi:hypothetical protein
MVEGKTLLPFCFFEVSKVSKVSKDLEDLKDPPKNK